MEGRLVEGEDLSELLEMVLEMKARLQQVFCYRAWGDIGGLDLESRKVKVSREPTCFLG